MMLAMIASVMLPQAFNMAKEEKQKGTKALPAKAQKAKAQKTRARTSTAKAASKAKVASKAKAAQSKVKLGQGTARAKRREAWSDIVSEAKPKKGDDVRLRSRAGVRRLVCVMVEATAELLAT